MAYTLNDATIDGNGIVASITVHLSKTEAVVCTVPVVRPQTKADVIRAIEQRVAAEQVKFDCAPVLTAIKAELDALTGKVALTASEQAAGVALKG